MRSARDAAVALLVVLARLVVTAAVTLVTTVERAAWQRKASPPRKRHCTPDDQTPVVPRVCQNGQTQPDNPWNRVDTNQPLNWAFQDAMHRVKRGGQPGSD
ncbi:MAG: hypothetical protein QOH91_181 [Mycobacterium sp.]|jgi:hypothetical protein|nr:hypothetical protein [Mycobacterium sp.]